MGVQKIGDKDSDKAGGKGEGLTCEGQDGRECKARIGRGTGTVVHGMAAGTPETRVLLDC